MKRVNKKAYERMVNAVRALDTALEDLVIAVENADENADTGIIYHAWEYLHDKSPALREASPALAMALDLGLLYEKTDDTGYNVEIVDGD